MMGCILTVVALLAPRVAMLLIWLLTGWFGRAFETVIWPLLGFLFMPYTTLAWMAGALHGGVRGWWTVLVVLAVLFDIGHWHGGGRSYRAHTRRPPGRQPEGIRDFGTEAGMASRSGGGLIGMAHRWRRAVAVVVVVALVVPLVAGCYGPFPLTRAVYQANGSIGNDVVRQVVFWVFVILPVYSVSTLADALVLNVVDFWVGETVGVSAITDESGNALVVEPDGPERAVLTVRREDGQPVRLRLERVSDRLCEVRDAEGRLLGRAARTADGGLRLTDAKCRSVVTLTARELARARAGSAAD